MTGKRRQAGTTARVAIVMSGEKRTSQPYLLGESNKPTLTRASVDCFLVTSSDSLGDLSCIRVWHDNSGDDPAWYVRQISVREVATKQVWHFLCETWLAVDEGDGTIDRVFPVASDEELKESKRLFLSKAYADLTDSHLWFSVFWRPPQSRFTKVQRVSCCLSLLLCGMMANAMWYEADQGRYTAVDLGPFRFSWEQVSIGICSSLVVFPINLLLVQIFRHCRPPPDDGPSCCGRRKNGPGEIKPPGSRPKSGYRTVGDADSPDAILNPRDRWAVSLRSIHLPAILFSAKRTSVTSSSLNLISPSPSNRTNTPEIKNIPRPEAKGLPWWFVYVGWFCVIVTSSTAAAVTLLYGIEFGRRKSEQWLFSLFVSVTQDIFVNQPLKVVFLAVVFAYIMKKPDAAYQTPSYTTTAENELMLTYSHVNEENAEGGDLVVPPASVPSDSALKKARDRRMKERQMHVILFDITTFLVFTLLVLLIAYGHRDQEAFRQNTAMKDLLLKPSFRNIKPNQFSQVRMHFCYATLCYATLCYAMLCYAMLCYAMLCYAMLCYAMLCYAMLRYAMLCYAMLCYAMLCYATLRYSMLCYATLCYALLCYVMLISHVVVLCSLRLRTTMCLSYSASLSFLSGPRCARRYPPS